MDGMTLTIRRRWLFYVVEFGAKVLYPQLVLGAAMAAFYPDKLTIYFRILCGLAIIPLFFHRPRVQHASMLQGKPVQALRPDGEGAKFRHVVKLVDTTIEPIGSDNPRPGLN